MDIKIFQIFYEDWQRARLDGAFVPYDNSGCPRPDEHEFYVFREEFLNGRIGGEQVLTGYVSWKFGEKTGLRGREFVDFIARHPGYDVYFVNPFPLEICRGNVWTQGDHYHPGLTELTQAVFDHAGYKIDLSKLPRDPRLQAFCNYWVGSEKFWREFMTFCLPVYQSLQTLPEPLRRRLSARAGKSVMASYFAYIFERLFTTFLWQRPDLRSLSYTYTSAQLTARYKQPGVATLVRELQNFSGSVDEDPRLAVALELYRQTTEIRTPFARAAYSTAQSLWHLVPGRRKLLRHSGLRRLSRSFIGLITGA